MRSRKTTNLYTFFGQVCGLDVIINIIIIIFFNSNFYDIAIDIKTGKTVKTLSLC